jgi:FAD/FMN-containing dehydrogenase
LAALNIARIRGMSPAAYEDRKRLLIESLRASTHGVSLAKRTSSNLFRYQPRARAGKRIDLSGFNRVLRVDAARRTLEVEGLATFETIVDHMPPGLVPLVTPELKHITVGGAIVGIGIESSCYRHGFVHDGMLEAEVLLPDGRIVACSAQGEHADLFRALPNSYGTLGYILRATMRLMPALPYVHLHTMRFDDLDAYLEAMRVATGRADVDFVEGIFYSESNLFLTVSRFVEKPPRVDDILRRNVFYRLIEREPDVYLTTKDYLFRYDPDWFWNLPETPAYGLFRRFAPASMRNSGFYKRYVDAKTRLLGRLAPGRVDAEEPLIQDWEVPWEHAAELTRFALREVDLGGKPWIVTAIRTPASPTLYPIRPDTLYYNLGCYCQVRKPAGRDAYHYTRIMDRKCFDLGGIKMLYSSTFLSKAEFGRLYNGAGYEQLKARYDPAGRQRGLFEKCVISA